MINLKKMDIGDDILILGSGDVGMIVARRLKLLGKNVIALLEKSDRCGGLERNRVNCLEFHNIPLITDCTVTKIYGRDRISGVDAKDLISGTVSHIPCRTLITSVGLVPEQDLLEGFRFAPLPQNIFLCGNCRAVHDTADAACIDGSMAGAAAAELLKTGKRVYLPVTAQTSRPLDHGEELCLDCPRGCILKISDGKKFGGVCKKYK